MNLSSKFSILIPSRGRIHDLDRLLRSIIRSTSSLADIEILITIDLSDSLGAHYIGLIDRFTHAVPSFDVKLIVRTQSDNLSDDYYNLMASYARGRVLWVLNDDTEIVTANWDTIVLGKVSHRGINLDDVWYFDVADSTRNLGNIGQFACFPMLTHRAYETLGFFFIPQIRTWAADLFLHSIYRKAGRIVEVPEVFVRHYRHDAGENFDKMQRVHLEDRDGPAFCEIDLDSYVQTIKNRL